MELKKVGKSLKLDITDIKNKNSTLVVVDVSAVMRSNYVKLEPRYVLDGDKYFIIDEETGNFILDESGNRIEFKVVTSKYKKRELSWKVDGKRFNTSSMYGLFRVISSFGFNTDFVFCFDSAYNIRKEEDSTYKEGRVKAENDYFTQLNETKTILENIGYTCLSYPGYEGDDLAVECVNKNKSLYENIVMVSNDYDLSQVIDDHVHFKHCLSGSDDITKSNFVEKLKCPYNGIVLYKSLVGDASDKIKGVKGFGPKAFYKFIEAEDIYGNMENIRSQGLEYGIIKNSSTLTDEQKKEALKCLWLVSPKVPDTYVDYSAKRTIKKDLFELYLEKYGMASIIKELKK